MWWYFAILTPALIVLWLIYEWFQHGFVQYRTTIVECHRFSKNREMRLCLISDLHNNRKNLETLTKRIASFSPEVILLAGDVVDKRKKNNAHAENFMEALSRLDIPVVYAPGNHELSLAEKYPQEWKKYLLSLPGNVTYLENESFLLNDMENICFSGLSLSRPFYKKGKIYEHKEELPEIPIPENRFHILLAHNPEYANMYKKYHADIIVSGHLHGGLLRLPVIGGVVSPRLRLPECDAGLFDLDGGSQLFISRGLGSHTIPLRFFNRVEINFLLLKGTE